VNVSFLNLPQRVPSRPSYEAPVARESSCPVSDPRNGKLYGAYPRVPLPVALAVALTRTLRGALVVERDRKVVALPLISKQRHGFLV
jgi:hypothetical protein